MVLAIVSCVGPVKEDLELTQTKLEMLEKKMEDTNAALVSVQSLVTKLRGSNYITSVDPVTESGRETGYDISFIDGDKLRITLGLDGLDGYSPSFAVKEGSDGHYYWTLDGEWLKNSSGDNLRADGVAANDVVIPQIKIENGDWMISTDGGSVWSHLADADKVFYFRVITGIDLSQEDHVTFILSDGDRLDVPRFVPISLSLGEVSEERVISPGEVMSIPYKVEGSVTGDLVITSGTDGIYTSEVIRRDAREGIVRVSCPLDYSDGYVFIMVHDGGYSSVKMINFRERKMDIGDGLSYQIDSHGGIITTPFKANFEFETEIGANEEDPWLHVSSSYTEANEGSIMIVADPNNTVSSRSGVINIRPKDNPGHIWATVSVTQASPYFSMDVSRIQAGSDGGVFNVEITSYRGISVKNSEEGGRWVISLLENKGNSHKLTLNVAKNHSPESRTATVGIYTSDGKELQGEVTIVQQSWDLDHYKDMVFQVRANMANGWEVYLPVRGEMNCFVDWGDGNVEIIDRTLPKETVGNMEDDWIRHQYSTRVPTSYLVAVSGSVEALNSKEMPRKGAITAVEQWGDVGLRSMAHAMEGCPRIFSLPADPLGAFSEVKDFDSAFKDCVYLKEIDPMLFSHAVKAGSFNAVFENCRELKEIPNQLFHSCAEATNMNLIFSNCHKIGTIPHDLFKGLSKVISFNGSFQWDESIREIPGDLFADCPEVLSFNETFCGSGGFRTIPADLFSRNTKVTSFSGTFYYCHGFNDIPGRLFANNPEVKVFSHVFGQCYGLENVPHEIFDNNRKVFDFRAALWDISIGIESPYTIIDGKKVHLYERINYPDHFVTPVETDAALRPDGWTDGNNVPPTWR